MHTLPIRIGMRTAPLLVLCAMSVMGCAPTAPGELQQKTSLACEADQSHACSAGDSKKTTICHAPPGNPANAHTLCIGNAAVPAHLAQHAHDHLGPCGCDEVGPPAPDGGAASSDGGGDSTSGGGAADGGGAGDSGEGAVGAPPTGSGGDPTIGYPPPPIF